MSNQQQTPKSMLLDLAFNLVIPVFILQKFSQKFGENGPVIALLTALAFPLGFGIYDLFFKKRKNLISLLGFINILFTGGFALMGLTRSWYIGKELMLPGLIGLYVWYTVYGERPFIDVVFYNENVFNISRIQEEITKKNNENSRKSLMLRSTQYFALTFLVSGVANFFIAQHIFTDIPYLFTSSERSALRNYEIAEMKKWHYIVLLIPSLLMTVFIMWHLISGLKKLTGLKLEEILNDHSSSTSESKSS